MRMPAKLVLITCLAGHATAQSGSITVQNLSPFGRREWVSAVVPFSKGTVHGLPNLRAGDGPTVWHPLGALWEDGSLRQAVCLFPVEMKRLSEVRLALHKGNDRPLPRDLAIVDPLLSGDVKLAIEVSLAPERSRARAKRLAGWFGVSLTSPPNEDPGR